MPKSEPLGRALTDEEALDCELGETIGEIMVDMTLPAQRELAVRVLAEALMWACWAASPATRRSATCCGAWGSSRAPGRWWGRPLATPGATPGLLAQALGLTEDLSRPSPTPNGLDWS